jgi:hypothetical protein
MDKPTGNNTTSNACTTNADDDGTITIVIDDRLLMSGRRQATGKGKAGTGNKQQLHGNKNTKSNKQKTVLVRTPPPAAASARPARPWVAVKLEENDKMFAQFQTGCALRSKTTHKSYLKLLATARKMCGGIKTEVLIKNAAASIATIERHAAQHKLSPNSVTSYFTAVLAVIKHTVACASKAKLKKEIAEWQAAHKRWQLLAQQPYIQNKATAKQQAGWIAYKDFCSVRDSLPDGSKAKLLFCMYSYIPPCRADLGKCRIFHKTPTQKDLASFTGNYISLQPEGSPQPSFLHLREFKTARCYAPHGVKVGLPSILVNQIQLSLAQHPRSYLFVQEYQFDKPYTRSAFSTMANKIFQRYTGIPDVNIQIIRHSYCTYAMAVNDISLLDPCKQAGERALCEKRLANIAHCMCHSLDQQSRYRFSLQQHTGAPEPISNKIVQRKAQASEPVIIELLE